MGTTITITLLIVSENNPLVNKYSDLDENTWHPKYQINPAENDNFSSSVCATATDTTIIVMVLSDYRNYELRDSIRKTWSMFEKDSNSWKVFFVIGKPIINGTFLEYEQNRIMEESMYYSDLIQLDLAETYHNCFYKVGSMLNWFHENCGKAGWMVKADDDIIFNPFVFKEVFTPNFVQKSSDTDLMIGKVFGKHKVKRQGRWKVGKGFKPNIFPPYTLGVLYILTRMAVTHTSTAYFSKQIPDLWIEDCYLTGVLREELGINLLDLPDFYIGHEKSLIRRNTEITADPKSFVTFQDHGKDHQVIMNITSEWRIQEFGRMTKRGGTYLEDWFNISKLHMGLELFIQAILYSNKHPLIQKEFRKEGIKLIEHDTPNNSWWYTIKTVDTIYTYD
jgi:hypothetical protein